MMGPLGLFYCFPLKKSSAKRKIKDRSPVYSGRKEEMVQQRNGLGAGAVSSRFLFSSGLFFG